MSGTWSPESLLNRLVAELCTDLVFRAVQRQLCRESVCPHCTRQCSSFCEKPGLDIYGSKIDNNDPSFVVECPCCKKSLAATRFAPHLEKCMGMGRQSARKRGAAVLKMSVAAAAEYGSDSETRSGQDERDEDVEGGGNGAGNDHRNGSMVVPSDEDEDDRDADTYQSVEMKAPEPARKKGGSPVKASSAKPASKAASPPKKATATVAAAAAAAAIPAAKVKKAAGTASTRTSPTKSQPKKR